MASLICGLKGGGKRRRMERQFGLHSYDWVGKVRRVWWGTRIMLNDLPERERGSDYVLRQNKVLPKRI